MEKSKGCVRRIRRLAQIVHASVSKANHYGVAVTGLNETQLQQSRSQMVSCLAKRMHGKSSTMVLMMAGHELDPVFDSLAPVIALTHAAAGNCGKVRQDGAARATRARAVRRARMEKSKGCVRRIRRLAQIVHASVSKANHYGVAVTGLNETQLQQSRSQMVSCLAKRMHGKSSTMVLMMAGHELDPVFDSLAPVIALTHAAAGNCGKVRQDGAARATRARAVRRARMEKSKGCVRRIRRLAQIVHASVSKANHYGVAVTGLNETQLQQSRSQMVSCLAKRMHGKSSTMVLMMAGHELDPVFDSLAPVIALTHAAAGNCGKVRQDGAARATRARAVRRARMEKSKGCVRRIRRLAQIVHASVSKANHYGVAVTGLNETQLQQSRSQMVSCLAKRMHGKSSTMVLMMAGHELDPVFDSLAPVIALTHAAAGNCGKVRQDGAARATRARAVRRARMEKSKGCVRRIRRLAQIVHASVSKANHYGVAVTGLNETQLQQSFSQMVSCLAKRMHGKSSTMVLMMAGHELDPVFDSLAPVIALTHAAAGNCGKVRQDGAARATRARAVRRARMEKSKGCVRRIRRLAQIVHASVSKANHNGVAVTGLNETQLQQSFSQMVSCLAKRMHGKSSTMVLMMAGHELDQVFDSLAPVIALTHAAAGNCGKVRQDGAARATRARAVRRARMEKSKGCVRRIRRLAQIVHASVSKANHYGVAVTGLNETQLQQSRSQMVSCLAKRMHGKSSTMVLMMAGHELDPVLDSSAPVIALTHAAAGNCGKVRQDGAARATRARADVDRHQKPVWCSCGNPETFAVDNPRA